MAQNWRRLLPVLGYVLLIFLASSIPSLSPPGPNFLLKDKIAHFIEYGILGSLMFAGIGWQVSRSKMATFGFLLAVGLSIGALDEIYQSFVPGREMSIYDWFADGVGLATGISLSMRAAVRRARQAKPGGSS